MPIFYIEIQMFRLSFICFFTFLLGYGQEKYYPEIDTALYRIYTKAHYLGRFNEAIISSKKLIDKSQKLNYHKGISQGNVNFANFLSSMGGNRESLQYLQIAEKYSKRANDPFLKSEIYAEYAMVYDKLGMFEISIEYYDKAIEIDKKIASDFDRKSHLIYDYSNKADIFQSLNKYDSAYSNYHKSYKLVPDPISASGLALYFIKYDKGKIDSASYYLKVATDSLNKYQYDSYQQLSTHETFGDFYFEKKNYNKSLNFYYKALKIALNRKNLDETISIYKVLSKTYQAMNDEEKASEYILKYTKLNDSINLADQEALNLSVNKLIKDQEEEKQNIESKAFNIFAGIFLLLLIIIILGSLYYRKKKKEKESIIYKQQNEIVQNKSETRNLGQKVNDAFREVLELAKKNDPAFLARFKEVYPDLCEKLLSKCPNIAASEFIFCAYLKLNFSTKEIAHYTFVTERAVQVRKSRLRKKMNIPSDEDLYIWINKI